MSRLWARIGGEAGVTAIEYALIASLIAIAIFLSVSLLGAQLSSTFDNVSSEVTSAVN